MRERARKTEREKACADRCIVTVKGNRKVRGGGLVCWFRGLGVGSLVLGVGNLGVKVDSTTFANIGLGGERPSMLW